MKKLTACVISVCMGMGLSGCYSTYEAMKTVSSAPENELVIFTEEEPETIPEISDNSHEIVSFEEETPEPENLPELEGETAEIEIDTEPQTEAETEILSSVEWGESYTTPEDVAEYIHIYSELPPNFITKNEAKKLGWDSSKGNLWDVAPNKSIGGDTFGNREGLLPDGKYYECDVNYNGGYRGAERLIFSDAGAIYYTNDHYQTFEQLY